MLATAILVDFMACRVPQLERTFLRPMLFTCGLSLIGILGLLVMGPGGPTRGVRMYWTWLSWPLLLEMTGFVLAFIWFGKEKEKKGDVEMGG